jgi:hypothetical protein
MRNLCLMIGAATMAFAAPALAQHGNGKGNGNGHGNGGGGPPAGHGNGKFKGPGDDRGGPKMARGNPGHSNPHLDRGPDRGPAMMADRGPGNGNGKGRGKGHGPDKRLPDADEIGVREVARGNIRPDRGDDRFRYDPDQGGRYYAAARGLIDGCPPGLAKKNNGCLPPGQARKIFGNAAPVDNWYGDWSRYRNSGQYDWRYDNGYLYRINSSTNMVSAFLPLLGGALFGGNAWPTNYAPQNYQVSPYYSRYFGYNDGLDYRYADGAILGVNPQTQTIDGIAALLTGNQWNVGSPMPAGYDLYNVPPAYRNQYLDSPTSMYRYSDGYVYQVDPKTQLVQQAIQLLGNVL